MAYRIQRELEARRGIRAVRAGNASGRKCRNCRQPGHNILTCTQPGGRKAFYDAALVADIRKRRWDARGEDDAMDGPRGARKKRKTSGGSRIAKLEHTLHYAAARGMPELWRKAVDALSREGL